MARILTYVGIVAGTVIIGIAALSLVSELSGDPLEINETFQAGESTAYRITGDAGAVHKITVTAERFEMELESPGGEFTMPRAEFVDSHSVEWIHAESGHTLISIQNTGGTEMNVTGTLSVSSDPIFIAYHIMVITTGVLIIGFTLSMWIRKPRGF